MTSFIQTYLLYDILHLDIRVFQNLASIDKLR